VKDETATVCLLLMLFAMAPWARSTTWYVSTNGNDAASGLSWTTAKRSIQAALDLAVSNDTVLVSNGVYATGGRAVHVTEFGAMTNRIVVGTGITLSSLNGPSTTAIAGDKANQIRCVYLGTNATLIGFTITNGGSRVLGDAVHQQAGGGIWSNPSGVISNCLITDCFADINGGGVYGGTLYNCTLEFNTCDSRGGAAHSATLYNCRISGNWCMLNGGGVVGGSLFNCYLTGNYGGQYGGAADNATLENCLVEGNTADLGGGARGSILRNCTVVDNFAGFLEYGGGVYQCTVFNSIVRYNPYPYGGTSGDEINHAASTFYQSCTYPLPEGEGNITNDPRFVQIESRNFRLAAGSPCIDAGQNLYVSGDTDVEGGPRVVGVSVDMGAYEFDPTNGYWTWAGAITNGMTNYHDDASGDGDPNLLEYATGGSPTNQDDIAALGGAVQSPPALQFYRNTNALDVTIFVEAASSLFAPVWSNIAVHTAGSWGGATNVMESGSGSPALVAVTDPIASPTNRFLRLRVTRP
jgi:hypothetical protein